MIFECVSSFKFTVQTIKIFIIIFHHYYVHMSLKEGKYGFRSFAARIFPFSLCLSVFTLLFAFSLSDNNTTCAVKININMEFNVCECEKSLSLSSALFIAENVLMLLTRWKRKKGRQRL